MPLKGYDIRVANWNANKLPGEEWGPMRCPVSHQEVDGRMVSSFGRLRTCNGLIHSGCMSSAYLVTRYRSGFGFRTELVHRLIALAFLGPPPSPQHTHVNHKDGDKQNNAVTNLEYVTPAENMAHYWNNKTAVRDGKCRAGSKPVQSRACNSNGKWTWHPSRSSAAKVLGLHSSCISNCIRGIRRQTGGYEFQAADVFRSLPGEEWREVDVASLAQEKRKRVQAAHR